MNKKEKDFYTGELIPEILEIEEQEIKEKEPPNNKIIDYKIIKINNNLDKELKRP